MFTPYSRSFMFNLYINSLRSLRSLHSICLLLYLFLTIYFIIDYFVTSRLLIYYSYIFITFASLITFDPFKSLS